MSLLSRILGGRIRQSGLSAGVLEALRTLPSRAGMRVGWSTALRVSAALACVRVIAQGTAQLPLHLYRRRADGGADHVTDHPVAQILRRPNALQIPLVFRESLAAHATLTGGGYALVTRVGGVPRELLPLEPHRVVVQRAGDWGLRYRVTWPDSRIDDVDPADMLHLVAGPSWDTIRGLDVVEAAREALGLSLAAENHAAGVFGKGGVPPGILTTAGTLTEENRKGLEESWAKAYGGENSGRVPLLTNGLSFTPIGRSAGDVQLTDTRRYQVEDVCRAFGVFPHMIGAGQQAQTYASAEAFFSAHVVHTLQPWIVRIEQTLDQALLSDQDRAEGYYIKHKVAGLLRGNARDRAAYYGAGIKDGWMTRNEVRALEELNPLDGLDEPLQPLNMAPAGEAPPEPDPPSADRAPRE
jgi:HK97 family phage portal protein